MVRWLKRNRYNIVGPIQFKRKDWSAQFLKRDFSGILIQSSKSEWLKLSFSPTGYSDLRWLFRRCYIIEVIAPLKLAPFFFYFWGKASTFLAFWLRYVGLLGHVLPAILNFVFFGKARYSSLILHVPGATQLGDTNLYYYIIDI